MVNHLPRKVMLCTLPLLMASGAINAAEVNISGYVKLDAIYDTDQRQGDLSFANQLETGDAADSEEGGFRMHARESRIRLTGSHSDSKVVIEGDFFGSGGNEAVSNSRGFRLRHAYGQHGNWTIGQNWSTFMDFMTYPKTLDFGTQPGVSFIRQAQIRYTSGNFSVALENPEASIRDASNVALTSVDPLPDVIAKYRSEGDKFGFYAAALLRDIEADLGDETESANATALHAGLVFKTGSGGRLGLNIITGQPGRYQQEKWSFADAILIDGDLEVIESTSFQLTYKHKLSNGSFNISYSELEIDDEHEAEVVAVGGFETVSEFHINRIWAVGKKIEYGIEVGLGEREEFSGDDGDNTRIQFSAKYKF
ncbi:MAG: DcaP family trimeric outer membrane transporter [Cellvibrionaceae bacterium]